MRGRPNVCEELIVKYKTINGSTRLPSCTAVMVFCTEQVCHLTGTLLAQIKSTFQLTSESRCNVASLDEYPQ